MFGIRGLRGVAPVLCALCIWALGTVAAFGGETVTVIDQLGRTVKVPARVERIVCLHHHTLDILLELGQGDKLVGVVEKWKGLLGDYAEKVYPRLTELPTPGGLNAINVEAVAALKPDVVFFAHQLPRQFIDQLDSLGIPAIGISLYIADREQASTIHPELVNPDAAYTDGMIQGLRLIGQVTGAGERAEKLVERITGSRALLAEKMKDLDPKQRVKVFMANPDMYTYGTGKYVGAALEHAGAHNVAEALKGYVQANMEQVTAWNPEVIFVQSRYAPVLDQIRSDPAWREIDAVKNGRLYIAPDYTKPWGHPCPESIILGEIWLARRFYPERMKDVDLDAMVRDFYRTFYGVDYEATL